MDYLYSIILGIIQGLTEFWPISSSGHLVVAHEWMDFSLANDLSFDVALHLGTLAALVIYFSRDIYKYIVSFFKSFANWNLHNDLDQRMSWFILVGTIPAAVVGFFISGLAETVFRNLWLVALLLIGIGLLFLAFERIFKKTKGLDQLGRRGAIIVGIAQVFAFVPGVSRSGITILAGLTQGLTRAAAARFSFLLSVPIVFGAGIKKIIESVNAGNTSDEWVLMLIGFLSAAIVGYLAVAFLMRYLVWHSLDVFAYYRILLGIVIILILLF
ncbi:undecaprenyl-diphosphatase UppP [Patescibacteria group bacterium]|nr:undecaprenyl-diphosphatase UppP [Patescibacteria group bacterium]MBU0963955.1 undecaprenyl-diphosphatase UppP [Patescibacteria group bacterium]